MTSGVGALAQQLTMIPVGELRLLMATSYVLAMAQAVHAYLSLVRAVQRAPEHEAGLVAFMLSLVLTLAAATYRWDGLQVAFLTLRLCPLPLLWSGALVALLDLALARRRRLSYVLPDDAVALLALPPVLEALGGHLAVSLYFVITYFLVRTVAMLAIDHRDGLELVSAISIVDAVRVLPTGVLYVDEAGGATFENDAMRQSLLELGIAADLADLSNLMDDLEGTPVEGTGLLVTLPSGEQRLFVRDRATMRGRVRTRYLAYDVTDLVALEDELTRANDQLRETQEQLIDALGGVRQIAESKAMLHMRARVHDVVGQRLSIMHRALEDGNVSDEAIAQLGPIITSAARDLLDSSAHATDDLQAIVDAYALAGTEVRVEGTLPDETPVSTAFLQIVREGATNAVRHAHATTVDVRIFHDCMSDVLVVTSDGTMPQLPLREGSGIAGMRRSVEALGGTLHIEVGPRFTIKASIPREGGLDARADR